MLSPGSQTVIRDLCREAFESLAKTSFDGIGITRASYDQSETEAMNIIAKIAEREGLEIEFDAAANLVVSLNGQDPTLPFLVCGSHLDSVPEGGNYDGAAGVIAGLAVLVNLKRQSITPRRSIKVIALRGEESAWFNQAYLGSKALLGVFAADDLKLPHRDSGRALEDYMREAGVDLDRIAAGRPIWTADQVAGYFELHIEQGPVMVARDLPLAIVTGIRGNFRHPSIRCIGEAAHSGAVPRWLRHDAVFAVSEFIMRLDRHWQALLEQGQDLVVTAGIIGTNPTEHAVSRVPGFVHMALEFRSESAQLLSDFEDLVRAEAAGIERLRGVQFEIGEPRCTDPATMTDELCDALAESCEKRSIRYERLPSGAGHDAAVFANCGIPSTMLFVRNEHGSHNPHEQMDLEDFWLGIDVLSDALSKVAERAT